MSLRNTFSAHLLRVDSIDPLVVVANIDLVFGIFARRELLIECRPKSPIVASTTQLNAVITANPKPITFRVGTEGVGKIKNPIWVDGFFIINKEHGIIRLELADVLSCIDERVSDSSLRYEFNRAIDACLKLPR